jgi:exodeoxyribonuclease VIII
VTAHDYPEHVYRALDAANWSTLKYLRESPLHYQHALTGADKDTTERAKGRAIHALVFEPAVFQAEFAIYEDGDRRGKVWEAFKEAHAGQTILKVNEVEAVAAAANAVRAHPLVAPYLEGGKFEQAVTWTDPATGLACKARMDWVLPERRVLIDLKSSSSIDQFRFGRIAARLGYHAQLAHYDSGCTHGLGWTPEKVLIVAVESEAPFDVGVFILGEDTLYAGREEVGELLAKLKLCRATGRWHGRYEEEQLLNLPAYVYGEEDEEDPTKTGITFGAGS